MPDLGRPSTPRWGSARDRGALLKALLATATAGRCGAIPSAIAEVLALIDRPRSPPCGPGQGDAGERARASRDEPRRGARTPPHRSGLITLGGRLITRGAQDEGKRATLAGLEMARARGDRRQEVRALRELARHLGRIGRFTDAVTRIEEALELARSMQDVTGAAWLRALRALMWARMGRNAEAASALQEAGEQLELVGWWSWAARAWSNLAYAVQTSDVDTGMAALARASRLLLQSGVVGSAVSLRGSARGGWSRRARARRASRDPGRGLSAAAVNEHRWDPAAEVERLQIAEGWLAPASRPTAPRRVRGAGRLSRLQAQLDTGTDPHPPDRPRDEGRLAAPAGDPGRAAKGRRGPAHRPLRPATSSRGAEVLLPPAGGTGRQGVEGGGRAAPHAASTGR